jgi:hypothetical protein
MKHCIGSSTKIYICNVANVCTYVDCSPTGISDEIPAYSQDELVSEDKWKHIRLLCCRQLIPDTIVLCIIQCLQLHRQTCVACTYTSVCIPLQNLASPEKLLSQISTHLEMQDKLHGSDSVLTY